MTPTKDAATQKFAVELRKIDDIRPYERNPRINDQAVDAVAASLAEFGFRQPIVVDADGVIIAGHTRWKAAKKLGLAKVPVHVATDLTPEQVRAFRIADNKLHELAITVSSLMAATLSGPADAEGRRAVSADAADSPAPAGPPAADRTYRRRSGRGRRRCLH